MSERMNEQWEMKQISYAAIVLIFALILIPMVSVAQDYPTKPINLTVCVAAGGTADLSTRMLASKAEKFLGQPVAVSNNGGGAGVLAMDALSKAKPDGYTLASCNQTAVAEIPHLRKTPYKLSDFSIVMQFAEPEGGLVVNADAPFSSLKGLIEYARKNPGKVTYTTSGSLTPWHVAMMYIAKQENIQWTAIPVPGGDPNMPLLGGHVTAFTAASSWKRYVDQGKFKPLVVYSEKRWKSLPNVPTLLELGYNYIVNAHFFISAPAGTPAPIVKKLDDAFKKAMDDPEFIAYMKKSEIPMVYKSAANANATLDQVNKLFEKTSLDLKLPKEQ